MLVYLHQYREDDENIETEVEEGVDRSSDEYFDVEDLGLDSWERIDRDGGTILRKAVSYDRVTAVSLPNDARPESDDGGGLPGVTVQLRTEGGDTEYVENATVIEVQDAAPS